MQFTTIALFAASAIAATITETDNLTTTATIISCGPEVTNCPARVSTSVAATNVTTPAVSSFEASGNRVQIAGVAALAAGALLAL